MTTADLSTAKAWLVDRMPDGATYRGLTIVQLGPSDTWAAIDTFYLGGRSAFLAAA